MTGHHPLSRASNILRGLVGAAVLAANHPAGAEAPPPVDVVLPLEPSPQRILTIQWNPLPLLLSKLSADVVVTPGDHHALVVSPFYAWPATAPIDNTDALGNVTIIEQQTFTGFGAELGYRYYAARGGPRGFFAGPSLILSSMTATAGNGSTTPFLGYGFALDVGYGAVVADRIALTLGVGAQYTRTNKTIPEQQFPAAIFANEGVFPRLLLAAGYSF
jgi:hypothetical protein